MHELPKYLLDLEEQSENSIHLPPFRYAGMKENIPPGTGLPYAFVEIEDGEYTEKDRIVKNRIYRVVIMIRSTREDYLWHYIYGIERVFAGVQTTMKVRILKQDRKGIMEIRVLLQ